MPSGLGGQLYPADRSTGLDSRLWLGLRSPPWASVLGLRLEGQWLSDS